MNLTNSQKNKIKKYYENTNIGVGFFHDGNICYFDLEEDSTIYDSKHIKELTNNALNINNSK